MRPEEISVHKHRADLEVHEYLYVEYESGVQREEVSADTWYRFSEGDVICFTSNIEGSNWYLAGVVYGGICGWIVIALTVLTVLYVVWEVIGGKSVLEAIKSI